MPKLDVPTAGNIIHTGGPAFQDNARPATLLPDRRCEGANQGVLWDDLHLPVTDNGEGHQVIPEFGVTRYMVQKSYP